MAVASANLVLRSKKYSDAAVERFYKTKSDYGHMKMKRRGYSRSKVPGDREARVVFFREAGGVQDTSRRQRQLQSYDVKCIAVGRVAKGAGTALSCSLFIVSVLLPPWLTVVSTTPERWIHPSRQPAVPLSPVSSTASLVTSRGSHFH